MSQKVQFVKDVQDWATKLAELGTRAGDLDNIYSDRGYNPGIVDADISSTGLTAAQVINCMTLIQQLDNLLSNATVTEADYWSTVNIARTDK